MRVTNSMIYRIPIFAPLQKVVAALTAAVPPHVCRDIGHGLRFAKCAVYDAEVRCLHNARAVIPVQFWKNRRASPK